MNDKGETDLHLAARLNLPGLTLSLLDHGANVNAKAQWGITPLHVAAEYNALETTLVLLNHGGRCLLQRGI